MHAALLRNFENSNFIWLDLLERSVILIMFGFFAVRMYLNFTFTYSIPVLLLLIAEILPVILVIFRKWSNSPVMSTNPSDWFLALVAANAPLLAAPGETPGTIIPQAMCSLILVCGFLIKYRRRLSCGEALEWCRPHERLRSAGHPVRSPSDVCGLHHPTYRISFGLSHALEFSCHSAALVAQVARILREERILNGQPLDRQFSSLVRYRLLPGVF